MRVDAAPELDQGAIPVVAEPPPLNSGGALVINATFDTSITTDPNAATIQAMINNAISIFQSLFNDPITVSILFRYSTTDPTGASLPSGALALSFAAAYAVSWNTYISALTADATTANDAMANASLPGSALSTNIDLSSADGRAVGLATPPAMFANGSVGTGGPYDGIITLNSSKPFTFTRPPTSGMYDAQRTTEHEMDEVLGLGSYLNLVGNDLRPQDLLSWSAPGTRNLTSSGSRYFSIDGGTTDIVGFNQNPSGDFGDWLSGSCPQANPYVQNAFSCAAQASDMTAMSPEGINLDVIGYDPITSAPSTTTTASSTTTTASSTTTTASSTTTMASSTTTTASSTTMAPTTSSLPTPITTTLPCTTARCALNAALASPACAGQTIPGSVTAKLTQAGNLIDQAATSSAKTAHKLLQKAKKALRQAGTKATRAAKGKKPKISGNCAVAITSAANGVLANL
jgi:hypothetical protein